MDCRALSILLFGILSACGGGPLGTVAATVTAPVTMPIMVIEGWRNDREAFLERAKGNRRALPPLDPESRMMADTALRQALDRGEIDNGIFWENLRDGNGRRAGGATLVSTDRTAMGTVCHDVLIETVADDRSTDQRVRTLCRSDAGRWEDVSAQGHDGPGAERTRDEGGSEQRVGARGQSLPQFPGPGS